MGAEHVLAVVAVSDFDASHDWYQRLLDAAATNVPMPGSLAEWRVTDTGWLQVFLDRQRAGTSLVNLAVADLDRHIADLGRRGIDTCEIVTVDKGVTLCSVADPDNNTVTFIGNFRERY